MPTWRARTPRRIPLVSSTVVPSNCKRRRASAALICARGIISIPPKEELPSHRSLWRQQRCTWEWLCISAAARWNERQKALQRRKTGLLGFYHFQLPRIPARMIIISGIVANRDHFERGNLAFQNTDLYRYHRNTHKQMEQLTEERSLQPLVTTFLADLAHANH